MSKLIDIFKRATETVYQPMGFRTNRNAPPPPKMVLIAEIQGADTIENARAADAILITGGKTRLNGKDVQTIAAGLEDIPWGLADGAVRATKLPAGCDFILFDEFSPVGAVPEDETRGKLMQIDAALDEGLVRAINGLPIDAVVIRNPVNDDSNFPLTLKKLMMIRRITQLVAVPVIVTAPGSITAAELKALRNAGIDGILLDAAVTAEGKVPVVKELIAGLPAKPVLKKNKAEALVPRVIIQPEPEPEPEPEEPDEDDNRE